MLVQIQERAAGSRALMEMGVYQPPTQLATCETAYTTPADSITVQMEAPCNASDVSSSSSGGSALHSCVQGNSSEEAFSLTATAQPGHQQKTHKLANGSVPVRLPCILESSPH